MIIAGRDLTCQRILVAEIGNNHEGDPTLACELVEAAAEAGADAVKIQIINPERLVNRTQVERIAQLARFRLPASTVAEMAALARAKGMLFMASAFDTQSLSSIQGMVDAIKIASGDLDFEPLLIQAARLGKPIILSTGMSTLAEVKIAVDTIAQHLSSGILAERLALLHCVSLYPAPLDQANLRAIETLRETFPLIVGYSDHTLGIEAAIVSLSLGARLIEKHFTLDKTRVTFRDHALSADPDDLRRLAGIVHQYDALLGDGAKRPSIAEVEMAIVARRSIVAARDLPANTRLTLEDFAYVRPRQGLPPTAATKLIGRTLRISLQAHDLVLEEHVK